MLIRAPGTLALISETSWALQCLIGALPAGRVCTRRAGGHLHGWHSETKKQHWRLFCVYIQFWVFPPKSFFWSWWWFSCLADPFWALGRLQLFALRCFGGGHNPRSSRQCTHSYFLQLEAFARVKKKKIGGDSIPKVGGLFRASSLPDYWFSLVISCRKYFFNPQVLW